MKKKENFNDKNNENNKIEYIEKNIKCLNIMKFKIYS